MIERLGLRVAFVGFSEILPFEFRARGTTPGSAWAFPARVTASVRTARKRADVVVAYFHWGIERDHGESARQRDLARTALAAGATVVLGAHPHVLQPIRRPPGRIVAYSLGNFVFSGGSAASTSTGILDIRLRAGKVMSHRFVRAHIVDSRPLLRR